MNSLPSVADYLSDEAKLRNANSADEADAFGRTAFNRYYYAAFLSTRDLLKRIERPWSKQAHKNMPDLLEKALTRKLGGFLKQQQRKGLMTASEKRRLNTQMRAAAAEMSNVLRAAYGVRLTADYEPEERVEFYGSTFRLATYTQAAAKRWLHRIDHSKGIILNVARVAGLV